MPAAKPQPKAASRSAKTAHATHTKKLTKVRVRKADGTVKTIVAKKVPANVAIKVATKQPLTAVEAVKVAVLNSMSFGRGLATFDLGGLGVPKPVKGKKATDAVRAAGITTPSGNLAKRYR